MNTATLPSENLVEISVADASLAAINWLIAKIHGIHDSDILIMEERKHFVVHGRSYQPGADWALGGPMLFRHNISTFDLPSGLNVAEHPNYKPGHTWEAEIMMPDQDSIRYCGKDQLDSGMRCLCEKYYGKSVKVPAALLN